MSLINIIIKNNYLSCEDIIFEQEESLIDQKTVEESKLLVNQTSDNKAKPQLSIFNISIKIIFGSGFVYMIYKYGQNRKSINELERQNYDQYGQLYKYNNDIRKLEKDVINYQNQNTILRRQNDEYKTKIQELEKDNSQYKDQIQELKTTNQREYYYDISQYKDQIKILEIENKEYKSNIKELEDTKNDNEQLKKTHISKLLYLKYINNNMNNLLQKKEYLDLKKDMLNMNSDTMLLLIFLFYDNNGKVFVNDEGIIEFNNNMMMKYETNSAILKDINQNKTIVKINLINEEFSEDNKLILRHIESNQLQNLYMVNQYLANLENQCNNTFKYIETDDKKFINKFNNMLNSPVVYDPIILKLISIYDNIKNNNELKYAVLYILHILSSIYDLDKSLDNVFTTIIIEKINKLMKEDNLKNNTKIVQIILNRLFVIK